MTSEICNFPQQIQPHPIPLAFYQHKMWSTLCVPRPHMQIDFWHILGRWQRQSIVKGQWTETQTEVFHATVSQPLPLCHFDFSICNLRFINFTLCSPHLPASSSSRIIYACIIIIELLRSCSSSFAYFSPIIFSHMRNISQLILIQYRAPICPIRLAICIFYDLFCQPAAAACPLSQVGFLYWSHNRTEVVVFWLASAAGGTKKKWATAGQTRWFFFMRVLWALFYGTPISDRWCVKIQNARKLLRPR